MNSNNLKKREMKKSFLMIAAATIVMVGCTNDNILTEVKGGEEAQTIIGFRSFNEKMTKGSTKPTGTDYVLEAYHETMVVYGSKKDVDDNVQMVFDGVTCTYDDAATDLTGEWKYAPARFWDKQSDYCFAAFAPESAPMEFALNTTPAGEEVTATDGKFQSTSDYTIGGQNLMQDNGVQAAEINVGFDGESGNDTDIMIADFTTQAGSTGSTVDLCFKHTLAKLVVALKANSAAPASDSEAGYTVKIKSIAVENYLSTGSYDTCTWTADATAGTVNYTYDATGDASAEQNAAGEDVIVLGTDKTYFIESLVFPQAINDTQTITVEYEITSQDGDGNEHTETYKYTVDADDVFTTATDYEEGSKYTISININPEDNVIKFDAGVYDWDSAESATPSIN